MSLNFPFFRFPKNNIYNPQFNRYKKSKHYDTDDQWSPPNKPMYQSKKGNFSSTTEEKVSTEKDFFDIFGIRLYHEDILLISLIFFLYEEGVDDTGLFIALIMLLLS